MSTFTHEEKLAHVLRAYERQIGRAATQDERDGLQRALTDSDGDQIGAKLALGSIMGTNTDWPYPTRRTMREEYGLVPDFAE